MKIYDFDAMFDEKLSDYISKNSGKYKESEWEDMIPKLYKKFGDTPIKSIGKSPKQFYAEMSGDDLVRCLKTHISRNISVPEFLCDEIEKRDVYEFLAPLLDGSEGERDYAVNLIGADRRAAKKYLEMLLASDDADFKNKLSDNLKELADEVATEALQAYKEGKDSEYMLEILSRTTARDDKIFEVLLNEFRSDDENIPMHASYLAAYGDERALPYLLERIDGEGITYIEYQELKFAIEALGGEYEKERDFSNDEYYKMIKESSASAADIFSLFSDKN